MIDSPPRTAAPSLAVLFALVAIAGCKNSGATRTEGTSSPGKVAAPSGPQVTTSFLEQLQRQAGPGPVYVVMADGAVAFRSVDMELHRFSVAGISAASYDSALDLLWLDAAGRLSVLDLRETDPSPHVLVEGVPDAPVRIVGGTNGYDRSLGGGRAPEILELVWSEEPKVRLELAFGEVINEDVAGAIRAATLVGAAWLRAHRERSPREDRMRLAEPRRSKAPTGTCEDASVCSNAVAFGASGWELYIAQHSCGDFCYLGCLLYAPDTRKVALPGPKPAWQDAAADLEGSCGPYDFDATGRIYAAGQSICEIGGGCKPLGGALLGVIGAGTRADLSVN